MTRHATLDRLQTLLVIIDVQEKLIPVIHESERLVRNIDRLVRGCRVLGVPAIVTEQYVKGLGPTVETIRESLTGTGSMPIEKSCFSAHGCEAFVTQLETLGRTQILLAGVETHVCVYQTAEDLLSAGFSVSVVADAVSSRDPLHRDVALRRMENDGAALTTTEMALFELTRTAGTDEFRAISRLIR